MPPIQEAPFSQQTMVAESDIVTQQPVRLLQLYHMVPSLRRID